MEIKEVYLDLKEWPQYAKKNKSVFKLESEAFKDPLKFKFVYDTSDLNSILESIKWLENILKRHETDLIDLRDSKHRFDDRFYEFTCKNNNKQSQIDDLREEIKNLVDENKKLQWEIKTLNDRLNTTNNKNDQIVDYIKIIDNRLNNIKPIVFEQTEFISWNGVYYYNTLNLPAWHYLVIQKSEILEHNEYALNRDSTDYFKVNVDDKWYTPFFQLQTDTWLDIPTATVKITFLFFPL